jgi:NDP-sugar pyrophosphorylase family protein
MPGFLGIVLAAGRGKRLRPLTDHRSKATLPVAGKPMVERVMEMLARGGVERFIAVVHPGDRALIESVGRPPWAGRVALAYQEQREGTAHALECAVPLIREDGAPDFVLASCDNLYPEGHVAALAARRREDSLDAALTLLQVQPEQIPTLAVVAVRDGRVTRLVEKPRSEEAPSDLGVPALYALSTGVLDYLPQVPVSPRGERDFPDALRLLIVDNGSVGGLLVEWRMTMTRPADLLALNGYFLRHDSTCAIVEVDVPGDASIIPPVRIEAGVELGSGCRVGPEVYLEACSRVGAGATVRRTVVLRGAAVEPGAAIEERVLG